MTAARTPDSPQTPDTPEQTPMEDPMTDNRPTDPEGTAVDADTPGTDAREPDGPTTPDDAATTQVHPTPAPAPAPTSVQQTPPPEGPAARRPAAPQQDRGVRVGTVVWGLVVAAVGVGLLAVAFGVVFDVELAFIALVAAAGVMLLVGSVVGARRKRR